MLKTLQNICKCYTDLHFRKIAQKEHIYKGNSCKIPMFNLAHDLLYLLFNVKYSLNNTIKIFFTPIKIT